MSKALIVYGTRYGASASTSQEIANILRQEGFDTYIINAKEEKIKDIAPFELIIVGSGIQINRWTSEPEDFLKKFRNQLASKKVALFVCCGSASQLYSDKPVDIDKTKIKYLDEKASKYDLNPIALGFFGGVYNFNKTPWWSKKALNAERPKIEASYKETEPGVYDTRDLNAIHEWTMQLIKAVRK